MDSRFYFMKTTEGGITILAITMDIHRKDYFLESLNKRIENKSERYVELTKEEYISQYNPEV